MHTYSFNDLKFTLKYLKRSYIFRSWYAATEPTQHNDLNHWVFLNYNFSKEQGMLPEGDRKIETCKTVLSVLMWILDLLNEYMCICWCIN